jgi:hypothetical protein
MRNWIDLFEARTTYLSFGHRADGSCKLWYIDTKGKLIIRDVTNSDDEHAQYRAELGWASGRIDDAMETVTVSPYGELSLPSSRKALLVKKFTKLYPGYAIRYWGMDASNVDLRYLAEDVVPKFTWSERVHQGDEIVWVDVEKVRASWSLDPDMYFDSDDHPNAIKGRIPRFDAWIKRGEAVQPPEVCLNDTGDLIFTNGRHRFVWMIQHGIESIPVAVPGEYVEEVRERYGID